MTTATKPGPPAPVEVKPGEPVRLTDAQLAYVMRHPLWRRLMAVLLGRTS